MSDEARWQRDLIVALRLEKAFEAEHLGFGATVTASSLHPSRADSERAVENIRAWRGYLPPPCVDRMIAEGWQWST